MNSFKFKGASTFLIAVAMTVVAGTVVAQDSETTYSGGDDKSRVKVPAVDKNGDGCIDKTEVTPGGQLEKRFATRDANGDGKLCKDEYYTP
ncbi:EF hand domain-containing protein [Panacagrimonas perspica]|uniref:EF hand domain-containing protein n=1 Tax=Panacagrimonas perspica TaxID=381431 RepID=A0A4S3JYV4_9GAMM|nr:hypothetical protein [Panacagrimonas perspica]TDU31361.1 EF hand domain-containing protein [Panacagrimonas perspica]THD00775.1 hypothetical protein B1810_22905 [Panacagrimonas perspica]